MSKRNKRFGWFDDWQDWFGPKTYGVGWTVKSWKGAVAIGVGICLIVLITVAVTHFATDFIS